MKRISKTSVYTVLLLDELGARSFQVRTSRLKLLCILFLLLFASSGFGGYLAYEYREQYAVLREKQRDTERHLAQVRRQLEPLLYAEETREPDRTSQAKAEEDIRGVSDADPAVPVADKANMSAQSPPTMNGADAAASALPEASPETPSALPHPAKISNMSLIASGGTRVRIAFDLSNQEEQLTLNGKVSLSVLTNTGETAEITQVDRADLRFRIRRYKRISAVFTLPPDIAMADVAFVQVRLNGDNMPPYAEHFPLQSL